jgi:hypothetical protein
MRLIASVFTLALLSSGAQALNEFDVQCMKGFSDNADSQAGRSWKGADKNRYCKCMKYIFANSADDFRRYNNSQNKPDITSRADWKCYVDSDRTTKSKFRP